MSDRRSRLSGRVVQRREGERRIVARRTVRRQVDDLLAGDGVAERLLGRSLAAQHTRRTALNVPE